MYLIAMYEKFNFSADFAMKSLENPIILLSDFQNTDQSMCFKLLQTMISCFSSDQRIDDLMPR